MGKQEKLLDKLLSELNEEDPNFKTQGEQE